MENKMFQSIKTRLLVVMIIVFLILMYLSFYIFTLVTKINGEDAIYEVLGSYLMYIVPVVWIAIKFKKYKVSLSEFIYKPEAVLIKWWQFIAIVVVLIFFSIGSFDITYIPISYVIPSFVNEILGMKMIYTSEQTVMPVIANIFEFLMLALLGPIIEELVFRGVLFNRFRAKWGVRVGIIVPALIFGVMHVDQIGAFIFAVIMTLLYIKTKNLLVPILCHILNNTLAGLESYIMYFYYGKEVVQTVEELRGDLYWGILFFCMTTPLIVYFIYKNWPPKDNRRSEEVIQSI